MKTKEAVNELMDFAKAQEKDIQNAYSRMRHMIKTGELDNITVAEVDDAYEFIKRNYTAVVNARNNGDSEAFSEALGAWQNERGN